MENFVFQNPTKIIFGTDSVEQVGKEIALHANKVLLHYGGQSIKKSGLYERVIKLLKAENIEIIELGGVVPNPRLSLIQEGIKLCKQHDIKFVLAVGGGSVIDSAKAIAVGTLYDGDIWSYYQEGRCTQTGLMLGTILTLPATGSEMNNRSVITNDDTLEKRGASTINPTFSILDAQLFATLPKNQVANGVVDMLAHCMERYFTTSKNVEITDRQLEAVMKTIIDLGPCVYKDPSDYDKYSQILWAGTIAHNYSLCVGRTTDWASHQIEHELSGLYDVAHGAGLSVVFPAWMEYVYQEDVTRFAMFANRVLNVDLDFYDLKRTALKGIEVLKDFYRSLNMPTTFKELGIPNPDIEKLALNSTRNNKITQGVFKKLDTNDIKHILQLANK